MKYIKISSIALALSCLCSAAFAATVRVPFESSNSTISVLSNSTVTVDLGSWAVGMRAYKTIVYTNTSNFRAAITNMDLGENLELVEGGCSTLNAGESCSMTFAYLVTQEGGFNANAKLYVTTSEGAVSNTFAFIGQAVPGSSVLSVSPLNANFTYSGESKSFKISNSQPFPVPVGTVVSSNRNWTVTDNTCVAAELDAGASCDVTVKYTATKQGTMTGSLNVLVNTIPFANIPLTGSIVYGYASFDTSQLDFKGVTPGKLSTKLVTISNTGQGKLVINNISYSGDPYFQLGSNQCPSVLEPGAKCSIEVKATIPSGKSSQGSVAFNFSNSGQSVAYLGVTGDANQASKTLTISPSPAVFESKLPGATSKVTLTISSSGADAVAIGQLSVTGSNFVLNQKQNCEGVTLDSGKSCSVEAVFNAPASEGASTGSVSVSSDAPVVTAPLTATTVGTNISATPSPITISGVDDGQAKQIVTVKNIGLYDTTVSNITVSSASFTVTDLNCKTATIKAGGTCTFSVAPTPTVGSLSGTVTVSYASGSATKSLAIPVSSKITAQGLKFDAFSCPTPALNVAGACTATLSNKGASPVTVSSLVVDNKTFGLASVVGKTMPFAIPANGSVTVSLPYNFKQEGSYVANVVAKNSIVDVSATASVVLTVGVTATLSDFVCPPNVLVGDTVSCTANLTNTGSKAFLIGSVKADNPAFVITHGCATQVLAGKSCVITAKTTLAQATTSTANVTVTGSLTLSKPISLVPKTLAFEVLEPSAITTSPTVPVNGVVKFKNVSGFPVVLTTSTKSVTGGGFSMTGTTCAGTLQNGATCDIGFKFVSATAITNSKGLATLTVAGQSFVGNLTGTSKLEKISVYRKPGLTKNVGFKAFSGNEYTLVNESSTTKTILSMGDPDARAGRTIQGAPYTLKSSTNGCRAALSLPPGASCDFYEEIDLVDSKLGWRADMNGTREIKMREGGGVNVPYSYSMYPITVALKDVVPILNVGEANNNTITITNTALVTLNNISLSVSKLTGVVVNIGTASCLTKLLPGQSCAIPVSMTANVITSGTLTWTVNGAYNKERNGVTIGIGDNVAQYIITSQIASAQPSATLTAGVYPGIAVGATGYATHTFANTGKTTINLQETTLVSADNLQTIVEDKCKGVSVRPGTSCTVKTALYAKPETIKYASADLYVYDVMGKSWKAMVAPKVLGDVVIDIDNTYCKGGIKIPADNSTTLNLNANQGSPVVCRVAVKNVGGEAMVLRGASVFKQAVGPNGKPETAPATETFYGFVPPTGETNIMDFFNKYPRPASVEVVPGTASKRVVTTSTGVGYEDGSFYNDQGGGFNIGPGASAAFILKIDNATIGGGKEHTLVIAAKNREPWSLSYKDFPVVAKFVVKYNVKHPEIVATSNANYPVTNLEAGQSVTTTYTNNDIEVLPVAIDSTGVAYPTLIDTFDYVYTNSTTPASNPRLMTNQNTGFLEVVSLDQKKGLITATNCVSSLSVTETMGSSRYNQTFAFATKSLAPGQSCQVRRSCLKDTSLNLSVSTPATPFGASALDYTKDASGSYLGITKVSDYIPYQQNGGTGAYGIYNEVLYSNSFGFFYDHAQRTQGIDPYIFEYYTSHSNFSGRYGSGRFVSSYSIMGGTVPNPATGLSGTITQFPLNPAYPVYQTKQLPALTCKLPKGWVQ